MIYSKEGILDKKFEPVDAQTEQTILENKKLNTSNKTFYKPNDSFAIKIIPDSAYTKLREMGETNITISRWMNNNLKTAVLSFAVSIILAVYFNHLFYIVAIFLPFYLIYNKNNYVKIAYAQWRFERRVQFNKFVRLVIPYLKQTESNISIYSILGKVAPRLDHQEDKDLLNVLRREIMDKPKQVEPFLDYSRKTANTNLSDNFMSSLYDVRMGSNDLRGIYELGITASEQLLHSIDQIIDAKKKKFVFFPTKLTFISIIPIIGFAVSYMIYELTKLDFGSVF